MPASSKHIQTNVDRMSGDAELTALWKKAATEDRSIGQAWLAFIEAADVGKIADRIPGSVGRKFRAAYAEELSTKEAVGKAITRKAADAKKATPRKAATKKATARKASTKKASK